MTIPLADKVEIAGMSTLFWVPRDEYIMYLGYLGPTFTLTESTWISPEIGVSGNWAPGSDAIIAALIGGTSHGRTSLFLDGEALFYDGTFDYYGYYALTYSHPWGWNAGIHAEQIDKNICPGPHIGLGKDGLEVQLRHYTRFQDGNEGHFLRIVFNISL